MQQWREADLLRNALSGLYRLDRPRELHLVLDGMHANSLNERLPIEPLEPVLRLRVHLHDDLDDRLRFQRRVVGSGFHQSHELAMDLAELRPRLAPLGTLVPVQVGGDGDSVRTDALEQTRELLDRGTMAQDQVIEDLM